jgi:hypothetical protein
MKMLRKRAWAEVGAFYSAFCKASGTESYGTYVDSQTLWRYQHGDDKHAIFGLAVNEGNTTKVADNIEEFTPNVSSYSSTKQPRPAAIWDACNNLYGYPIDAGGEFIPGCVGQCAQSVGCVRSFY